MWRSCQVLVMDFAATAEMEIDLVESHVNPSLNKRFNDTPVAKIRCRKMLPYIWTLSLV